MLGHQEQQCPAKQALLVHGNFRRKWTCKEGNGCQQRKDVNWKSASFLPPHFHLPPHPTPQLYGIRGTQNLNTRKWLWPWQRLGCIGCCINCNLERIHCHQSSSPPNITLYMSFFIVCLPLTLCCDPWKVPVTMGWMNEGMNDIKEAH